MTDGGGAIRATHTVHKVSRHIVQIGRDVVTMPITVFQIHHNELKTQEMHLKTGLICRNCLFTLFDTRSFYFFHGIVHFVQCSSPSFGMGYIQ